MRRPHLVYALIAMPLGLLVLGAYSVIQQQKRDKLPTQFFLVEPNTCALFIGNWSDEGFVQFIPESPTASCERGGRDGLEVTCTVRSKEQEYAFAGTLFQKADKLVVAALGVHSTHVHFEMVCDQRGSCDFGRLWNDELRAGFACLRDSAWQKKDDGI